MKHPHPRPLPEGEGDGWRRSERPAGVAMQCLGGRVSG